LSPGNGSNRSIICSGITGWPTVVEAEAKFDHYLLDAKAAFTCVEKTMLGNQNIAAFILTSDFGSNSENVAWLTDPGDNVLLLEKEVKRR